MSNIYIFWVFNIFFLATQLHTYGLFHIGSNIKDKAISFNFYLSSRISTSPLYEWERYFPCSGKMFCLSACTHKNSYSQNEPNYLAMNRKSEFELVFGRKWFSWHCNFSLSTRKLLKNLNPEFPHSWNNCHVLFLRFQRHWCGSALNLSSQEPDPVFNDRGWFCAFGFSPANAHWLLQQECDKAKCGGRPLYPLQWFLCAFLPTSNFLMAGKKQIWAAWAMFIYKRTSLSGILRKREGWTERSGKVGYSPQTSCWTVFSSPYF